MSEPLATIVATLAKTTENYAVYESAEVGGSQALTGTYVHLAAFDGDAPDFIEVRVGDDEAAPLAKKKDTTNYGVYETEGGAISGMYVSHDSIDSPEGDEGDREAPEDLAISLAPATEDDFEEAQDEAEEAIEEEASALLGDAGSDDEVEVSTEEEAADLMEEAEAEAE